MKAAQANADECVFYLIDTLGANPYVVDNYGRTALDYALTVGDP